MVINFVRGVKMEESRKKREFGTGSNFYENIKG